MFGGIDLITRTFADGTNENVSLRNEIQNELDSAYRSKFSNVHNVSVIFLDKLTEGNIRCYYEILLNGHSRIFNTNALRLFNATLYDNSLVEFGGMNICMIIFEQIFVVYFIETDQLE